MSSLLPANATAQERAIEASTARVGFVPVPIRDLWNPDTCPAELLPWLAWAWSVDEWDANWPEATKRDTVRDAFLVQSRKGTRWSMERVLANAGYAGATIQEGRSGLVHDGTGSYDGGFSHGSSLSWAEYRVIMDRPITNSQADQVRRLLANTAPARCLLYSIVYDQANNIHNGAIYYDGQYNHGAA